MPARQQAGGPASSRQVGLSCATLVPRLHAFATVCAVLCCAVLQPTACWMLARPVMEEAGRSGSISRAVAVKWSGKTVEILHNQAVVRRIHVS